jgi:hypothetical protein
MGQTNKQTNKQRNTSDTFALSKNQGTSATEIKTEAIETAEVLVALVTRTGMSREIPHV